jgi:hypothetical protein
MEMLQQELVAERLFLCNLISGTVANTLASIAKLNGSRPKKAE